jgi:hypothetical protein
MKNEVHIIPVDDTNTHFNNKFCKCQPDIIQKESIIIFIHNSFDKREIIDGLLGEEVSNSVGKTTNTWPPNNCVVISYLNKAIK